ncbi:MAG: hypothetical protein UZ12_BCD005001637 [Bacteroidetes bacterium OLB12]|nr:MAG: hypothetical protein UZ12_BCD005001637 [Bacteroidetes bacterium OLB12]HNR73032.1 hypothetical protein [Cyclobacteriaceae bacterium]HNU41516.1 hypothetical protein [Cyclobacteriaceae bacterium]
MKMKIIVAAMLSVLSTFAMAQEFKVVTVVESIVPAGVGRSRMIEEKQGIDHKALTTERTDGSKSDQSDVKRSDIKIDAFSETKLLNFYSIAGINFQNIASNDAVITSKINDMVKEGWNLVFVSSAVESDAGKSDGVGIFITRLYFKR